MSFLSVCVCVCVCVCACVHVCVSVLYCIVMRNNYIIQYYSFSVTEGSGQVTGDVDG